MKYIQLDFPMCDIINFHSNQYSVFRLSMYMIYRVSQNNVTVHSNYHAHGLRLVVFGYDQLTTDFT